MNKIVKTFKHIFIPHEHNDYKPHFFREFSVGLIVVVLVFLFSISASTKLYINRSDMMATVLPAVLVDLTNTSRVSNGLSSLTRNPTLDIVAELKARDMVTNEYFAHTSPQGVSPWYWFSKANYIFSYAGENLAIDFSESEDVEKAWMNSPTHKENILNSKFTEIGIATAEGYYNGHPTTYVVQMFGRPLFSSKIVSDVPIKKENTIKDNLIEEEKTFTIEENADLSILPVVKGEDIKVFPEIKDLEIIKENDEFISVKNHSIHNSDESVDLVKVDNYSKWYERFLFRMPSYVDTIYRVIIYIIIFALILMIIIETKKQHLKNIIYGILLLVIILCLVYLNKSFFLIDFLL